MCALDRRVRQDKAGVASRGCAIGKSGGVHGLPAPQILTYTSTKKKKNNIRDIMGKYFTHKKKDIQIFFVGESDDVEQ